MNGSDSVTRAEKLAGQIADAIWPASSRRGRSLTNETLAERYSARARRCARPCASSGRPAHRDAPSARRDRAHITSEQLESLFVAMGEIEATCARLAALSMTPIERRRLAALHDKMAVFVEREDEEAYAEANLAFHGAIYAGTRNTIIEEIAIGLRRRAPVPARAVPRPSPAAAVASRTRRCRGGHPQG